MDILPYELLYILLVQAGKPKVFEGYRVQYYHQSGEVDLDIKDIYKKIDIMNKLCNKLGGIKEAGLTTQMRFDF